MPSPFEVAGGLKNALEVYQFFDELGKPTPEQQIIEQLERLEALSLSILEEVEASSRVEIAADLAAIQAKITTAADSYKQYLTTGDYAAHAQSAITNSTEALDELLAYSTVGSVQKALMIPSIAAALALRNGVINDIEAGDTSFTYAAKMLAIETFFDDFVETMREETTAGIVFEFVEYPNGFSFREETPGDGVVLTYSTFGFAPEGEYYDPALTASFEFHSFTTDPANNIYGLNVLPWPLNAVPFSASDMRDWADANGRPDISAALATVMTLAFDLVGGPEFIALGESIGDLADGTYHRDVGGTESFTVTTNEQGVVFGLGGDDTVTGAGGNDVLYGDDANELDEFGVAVPFGDDELRGLDGNDNLFGGAGNDLLLGGVGQNRLEGGTGNDTVSYEDAASGVTALLTVNVFQQTGQSKDWIKGVENLTGSNFDDALTGNGFANILRGLDGDDTLKGLQGDDTLLGGDGNDSLRGNKGNDTLEGGAGNDTLHGGSDDDLLFGGDGTESDYLHGGSGNDTAVYVGSERIDIDLSGNSGNNGGTDSQDVIIAIENLTTGSGWDELDGNAEDNHFISGAGNDKLSGRGGDDTLDGGDGFDTVSFWENTTGITVDLDNTGAQDTGDGLDTIHNIEAVWGGTGNDLIKGTSGGESFFGLGGDDVFEVAQGFRNLDGGAGFDTVRFLDNVNTGVNLAYSQIAAGGAYDLYTSIEAVETGTGNDTVYGDDFANRLSSGGGNDTLRAGLGDDTIDGGAGIDLLTYEGSTADINVDLGDSAAQATGEGLLTVTGVENVYGGDGNDSLTGDDGNNVLFGDDGNDTLNGGLGNDTLNGGLGSEIDTASYAGLSVNVTVDLRLQNGQTQNTGAGVDYLYGIENLTGGNGNDLLIGTSTENALSGGLGNDTLLGGLGDDTLDGGAGFDFARFETALGLTIDLAITGAQNVGNGVDTFISIEGLQTGTGNDTIYGTTGADHIISGAGNDIIFGRGGNDTLDAGDGFDVINFSDLTGDVTIDLSTGGAVDTGVGVMTLLNGEFFATGSGNDLLIGDAGNTAFSGGAGNDTMIGGLGDDSFYGSTGIDLVSFAHMTTAVTVDLSNNSTSQNSGEGTDFFFDIESVEAGSGNDALSGGFGDNYLSGGLGNDTLTAGPSGVDTLDGGGGDDALTGSGVLIGGAGDDTLNGGGSATVMFTGSVAVTVDLGLSTAQNTGHGIDTLLNVRHATGGDGNDLLISSGAQYTRLNGGAGDDTLRAEGGDTLPFGFGYDTLEGGAGNDTAEFLDTFDATIDLGIVGQQYFGHRFVTLIDIESVETDGGNDSLTGNDGANHLSGGADDDTLEGGAGNDTLEGGADNDILEGGLGDDTLDGGTGIDTALFLGNTDTSVNLGLSVAQNTGHGLDTFVNIENIVTGGGNDALTGDAGNNVFDGGLGNDTFDGGAGSDTVIFDGIWGLTVDLRITGAQDTGYGFDSFINIENVSAADANSSTLIGNDSANLLIGSFSYDDLTGGMGDDTLDGGASYDNAYFYGSEDVSVDLSLTTAQDTGHGFDTILNIEAVTSGSGNDTLRASDSGNSLRSGAGNDLLVGGSGEDYLTGEDGNDVLSGGAGNDGLNGGNGDDTLSGGLGDDVLNGGHAGRDTAQFLGIIDTIVDLSDTDAQNTGHGLDTLLDIEALESGSGNDHLSGSLGANLFTSGSGNDTLLGDAGNDTLLSNKGNDSVRGNSGLDLLAGGKGNDKLYGGSGKDVLEGNTGDDRLFGGSSGDVLNGGKGNDWLVGSTGSDDFIFKSGDGDDTIRDFDATNNKEDIDLSAVSQIEDFADLAANHMLQVGDDVEIDDGDSLTITLLGVDLADLGNSDFIF